MKQVVKKVRLMNTKEDYEKLGINSGKIEMWEDQRRDNDNCKHWEWWYFDAILDDGTTVVVQFITKTYLNSDTNVGDPIINFKVNLADGTKYEKVLRFKPEDCTFGSGKCDVHYGENYFIGDLKNYKIYAEDGEGMTVDLEMSSLSEPFRPGSSYIGFGDNDEDYYTWLCAVPKGEVKGKLMINGESKEIHGYGYHDHQWGSFIYFYGWNNWTWARQSFDDYTLLVFDMIASEKYGEKRFPLAFIEDKDGKIIFSNTDDVEYEVFEEYKDEASGKLYPKKTRYTFKDKDRKVIYTLEAKKVLESTNAYELVPPQIRSAYDEEGIKPSYCRYLAEGTLEIIEDNNTIKRSGELIYEFMFPGITYKK